jgi:tRNA threonylcarbamoyladenosine biosynthesis protein TsaE
LTRTGEPAPRLLAEICVPTAARMRWLGRRLAVLLRPGDLIVLNGQLGAGKTTLVQGIGDGLDVRGPVTSPTFVIARIHPALRGGPALVHVDAYRLSSPAEVDDLDLDADLDSSVTVVEWGGGLAEGLAPSWLEVTISLPRHGTAGRVGDGEPGNAGSEPGDGDGGPAEATGGASGAEAVLIAGGISGAGTGLAAGGGSDTGPGLAAGGFSDPGDEPRAVRLAGRGARWAAAAESVHLALLGAAEVL